MEWIKIDDRKPPNNKYVLVAFYDGRPKVQMHFIQIAERINEDWFDSHNGDPLLSKSQNVTHWMALPDVPN